LSIIDITNEPVEVGFVSATGNNPDAKDVKVYDHYAILIEEHAPAQVIDLSDPTNPNVVSTIEFSGGGAHNCYIDGQYLYAVGHDIDGFESTLSLRKALFSARLSYSKSDSEQLETGEQLRYEVGDSISLNLGYEVPKYDLKFPMMTFKLLR
jgi:hypothetical protein